MTLALAGCLVGLLTGLSGTGGGSLLTPLLVLAFGLPTTTAVSSDLLVVAVFKLVATTVHQARQEIHRGLALWLSCGGVPAALVGPLVIRFQGPPSAAFQHVLAVAVGAVLLGAALLTSLTSGRSRGELTPAQVPVRRRQAVLLGALTGLVVGFTSVGSGSMLMVVLLLCYPRLKASVLVATDVAQALPMVVTAALGHLLTGDLRVDVVWPLLLGGLPGVLLGAYLVPRVPALLLRSALQVLLAATGTAMLTGSLPAALVPACGLLVLAVVRARRAATTTHSQFVIDRREHVHA